MRRLLPLALAGLCGCSVLFDPGKVPPAGCPVSPAACPALPNATASCADEVCVYSCAGDFVDANGDLQQAAGNGCEVDCTQGAAPENPARLVATVGAAAGEVEWTFPEATPAPARYRLCTAPPGGTEVCVNLEPATACSGGGCAQTTTGHADNVRVTGRLVSVDACGREGVPASAPTVSATPLDTGDPLKWTHEKSCAMSTYEVSGGRLAIDQPGALCASTLVAGDELWGDFTIDADLDHGISAQNMGGGLAAHVSGTGYRVAAIVYPESIGGGDVTALTQRLPAKNDEVVASSTHGADATGHTHLRLVSSRGVYSLSLGPTAAAMREVLRWPDTQRRTGKVGVGAVGQGRIELNNLRVSTASELPPAGPASLRLDFADGGLPADTRKGGPAQGLTQEACPAFPEGGRCDGGCAPGAGARCLKVNANGLANGQLFFDLPAGIDVHAPWRLAMRFAPQADAGVFYPALVASRGRAVFGGSATWTAPARGLTDTWDASVAGDQWHRAELAFDPDAGAYRVVIDEVAPSLQDAGVFPPAGWNGPHLGVLGIGGGFLTNGSFWVADVEITQP